MLWMNFYGSFYTSGMVTGDSILKPFEVFLDAKLLSF